MMENPSFPDEVTEPPEAVPSNCASSYSLVMYGKRHRQLVMLKSGNRTEFSNKQFVSVFTSWLGRRRNRTHAMPPNSSSAEDALLFALQRNTTSQLPLRQASKQIVILSKEDHHFEVSSSSSDLFKLLPLMQEQQKQAGTKIVLITNYTVPFRGRLQPKPLGRSNYNLFSIATSGQICRTKAHDGKKYSLSNVTLRTLQPEDVRNIRLSDFALLFGGRIYDVGQPEYNRRFIYCCTIGRGIAESVIKFGQQVSSRASCLPFRLIVLFQRK